MDNISREAAIDALGKKRYFGAPYTDHEVSYNTAIEDAIAALSALPAVDGWLPIEESDGWLCQVTDGVYVVTAFKQDGHWVAGWQNETMAIQFVLSPTHYRPLPAPPIE